jgi:hypothetical protein
MEERCTFCHHRFRCALDLAADDGVVRARLPRAFKLLIEVALCVSDAICPSCPRLDFGQVPALSPLVLVLL